jgi:hypothetical protein
MGQLQLLGSALWYWGLKLHLITTAEGMPLAWCLADPKLGEREVAEELLGHARDHGALRDGMIVLADKGLSGKELEHFAAAQIGVLLARHRPCWLIRAARVVLAGWQCTGTS